ncbi:MAG: SDR family oxidoreductase [Anaerolineales bacterium]
MDLGLKHKVALVTAASRGLGKAAALEFAREGAKVVMCARSDLIETAAQDIRSQTGAEVLAVKADVTDQGDIDRMVGLTLEQFGQIDILIINCRGPQPGGFLDLQPEDWEAASQLTLMSAVRLCYAVVPHMLERGSGSIVANQSFTVKQPLDNLILSNSIRLAVIGLMKSLANELGSKGIRVNSINPGWTRTERVDQLLDDRAQRAGTSAEIEAAKITAAIPLGRMGSVDEFGKTIAWLASPAASFIHGQALLLDGGIVKAVL